MTHRKQGSTFKSACYDVQATRQTFLLDASPAMTYRKQGGIINLDVVMKLFTKSWLCESGHYDVLTVNKSNSMNVQPDMTYRKQGSTSKSACYDLQATRQTF